LTDRQIAVLVRNRDERAINHAINKYSRLLWKVVQSTLAGFSCNEEVEECVADVFIHFWQNPHKYDEQRGSLKSYLCIVARSKAADRYRSLCRRNTEHIDAALHLGGKDILDGIIWAEDARLLNSALDNLDEPDKEIILRRYYHRQKPSQISIAMDIPVKQVENRLYRAKLKLRKSLMEGGAFCEQK